MIKEAIEINFNREDELRLSNAWSIVLEKHKTEDVKPRGSP
jgi:hypothetical protein